MRDPREMYWEIKLLRLKEILERNGFEAFLAKTKEEATEVVLKSIIPQIRPKTIAFGGSMTVVESGLYDAIKRLTAMEVIDTYDTALPLELKIERRRQALLADLFITGTNAVTEEGHLVNLDGMGNRVAAIAFGPRYVVVLCGINKVVPDLEAATVRIQHYAAPANAMRLERSTPCTKTASCEDCRSPERICNIWSIVERSVPAARIKVVLIAESVGL